MIFKPELSPQNFHYDVLYPLYSGTSFNKVEVNILAEKKFQPECNWKKNLMCFYEYDREYLLMSRVWVLKSKIFRQRLKYWKETTLLCEIKSKNHPNFCLLIGTFEYKFTQPFLSKNWAKLRGLKILKVIKNRNDFMKTLFLPKTNEIIVRISACYIIGQKSWQKFCWFLGETMSS